MINCSEFQTSFKFIGSDQRKLLISASTGNKLFPYLFLFPLDIIFTNTKDFIKTYE
jgi:hypothetical protein